MCIASINCSGTLTHVSGRVRRADSGVTKLTTRYFIPNPCVLHQLNNSLIFLSSESSFSQTGSGLLLGSADCSMPTAPPQNNILGFLWLPFLLCYLHLLPWQGLVPCHYLLPGPGCPPLIFLPGPGCPLLIHMLLGPYFVGYSVTFVVTMRPRRSVIRIHSSLINEEHLNKLTKRT